MAATTFKNDRSLMFSSSIEDLLQPNAESKYKVMNNIGHGYDSFGYQMYASNLTLFAEVLGVCSL